MVEDPVDGTDESVTVDPVGPSGTSGVSDAAPDRLGQALDLVTYAVATTLLFSGISATLGVLVGSRPAPSVKYGLFVFGWLSLGYGTLSLMPTPPWKDDEEASFKLSDAFTGPDQTPDTKFHRLVQSLPPARFRRIPHQVRLSTGTRVFVAALVMMAVSIVMEQAFGVGP